MSGCSDAEADSTVMECKLDVVVSSFKPRPNVSSAVLLVLPLCRVTFAYCPNKAATSMLLESETLLSRAMLGLLLSMLVALIVPPTAEGRRWDLPPWI